MSMPKLLENNRCEHKGVQNYGGVVSEFGLGGKIGPAGSILATKSGPAGPKMTPKFVRLIPNWSRHINTFNTWRLTLFSVKMANSSEERDAKNGNLVEEAYEYFV